MELQSTSSNPSIQIQTGGTADALQTPLPLQKDPLLKHAGGVGGGVGSPVGAGVVCQ